MPTSEPSVGQAFMVGFTGTDAASAEGVVRRLRPAGLALLPRNIVSRSQLADLTGGLRDVARREGMPPLFLAIDQEGGAVARLNADNGFPDLPSAMSIGRTGDLALARDLATATASELASVGINLDLAPVADLALDPQNMVIGSRSFGSDPTAVSGFVSATIEGLHRGGVLACVKHFPGHGSTHVDSHLALPHLDASESELRDRDLVPFRGAIAADVDAVMTAHVVSPLDPTVPATLSRRTLVGVLRRDLGFDGLVLSDALDMKALAGVEIPPWQVGAEALRAGADVLIFERDTELIERSHAWIGRCLADGELDPALVIRSRDRVDGVRARLAEYQRLGTAAEPWPSELVDRAILDGLSVSGPLAGAPFDTVPVVIDVLAGHDFADAVGWPLCDAADATRQSGRPVIIVGPDAEELEALAAIDDRALASVAAVVVLGGTRSPSGLGGSMTVVLGFDSPRGQWRAIATTLYRGAGGRP